MGKRKCYCEIREPVGFHYAAVKNHDFLFFYFYMIFILKYKIMLRVEKDDLCQTVNDVGIIEFVFYQQVLSEYKSSIR